MPANTPIFNFPYPLGTDPVAQGDNDIRALAEDVETVIQNDVINVGGLWLVKTQTVGAGVSVETVTGAFTDDYEAYRIMYTGGVLSANANLLMYMGNATASAYFGGRTLISSAGSTAFAGDNNTAQWNFAGYGNTGDAFLDIVLGNPKLAKNTKIQALLNDVTDNFFGSYVGVLKNVTAYTSFSLSPSGGRTMTGGTIRVYGFRK